MAEFPMAAVRATFAALARDAAIAAMAHHVTHGTADAGELLHVGLCPYTTAQKGDRLIAGLREL